MPLQRFPGTKLLTNNNEFDLFDLTALTYHSVMLSLKNMVDGDVMTVRVYWHNDQTSSYELYRKWTFKNAQTETAFSPNIPSTRYKVSIQQTVGTLKTFTWVRYEN